MARKIEIRGGKPLHGELEISGAKNAAIAIIPAAMLVDGVCRIENIPQISDVSLMLTNMDEMGASIRTINRTTMEFDCRDKQIHEQDPRILLFHRCTSRPFRQSKGSYAGRLRFWGPSH